MSKREHIPEWSFIKTGKYKATDKVADFGSVHSADEGEKGGLESMFGGREVGSAHDVMETKMTGDFYQSGIGGNS